MEAVYPFLLAVRPRVAPVHLDDLERVSATGAVVAYSVCRTSLEMGMGTAGEVFHVHDAHERVDVAFDRPTAVYL